MSLLISFFLLSIIFSFLCSIWEAVLLSVTPSFIKRKEQEDPPLGKLLASLKNDIDKPLSAILTLNTIAHTVGAIGVGAQAGKLFGTREIYFLGLENHVRVHHCYCNDFSHSVSVGNYSQNTGRQ